MNCYLMRHGDAVAATENPERPLSKRGRATVEEAARKALKRGMRVSRVYHSDLLRAGETAAIIAGFLKPASGAAFLEGLAPEEDPMIAKAELEAADEPILLVSHLPLLSRLASSLIHGDPERPTIEFLPATLVCLTRRPEGWETRWRIAV